MNDFGFDLGRPFHNFLHLLLDLEFLFEKHVGNLPFLYNSHLVHIFLY